MVENKIFDEPVNLQLDERAYKYKEGGASASVIGSNVTKVEYDPVYGFKTWFEYCVYPVNAFPDRRSVLALTACDTVKKALKWQLTIASMFPFRYLFLVFLILPRKVFLKVLEEWFFLFQDFSLPTLKEFVYDPAHYSRSVKSFYKAIKSFGDSVTVERIADAVGTILEQDHPYRYHLQDLVSLVNIVSLRMNPAKEMKRVLQIFAKRDKARNWKRLGMMVYFLMFFFRPIREGVVQFLTQLDYEKVRLDVNDRYNCYLNDGYDYDGLMGEERRKAWEELHRNAEISSP